MKTRMYKLYENGICVMLLAVGLFIADRLTDADGNTSILSVFVSGAVIVLCGFVADVIRHTFCDT